MTHQKPIKSHKKAQKSQKTLNWFFFSLQLIEPNRTETDQFESVSILIFFFKLFGYFFR